MADKTVPASPAKKTIKMVRMNRDVSFFNIAGSQVSARMGGIHLVWNGDVVVVTHDGFPGEERWLFPGGIQEIAWETPKADE